jgi:hypothetical protein
MESEMNTTLLDEVIPPKDPAPETSVAPFRRAEERANVRKGPVLASLETAEAAKPGATGFLAIGEDLERRSREWSKMVRLLQQHREFLDSAETERDAAYAELESIVPVVQATSRELEAAMDAVRAGEEPSDLSTLFVKNGEALDALERVAVALTGHFLRVRSAWDQYTRSIAIAQRLRAEMHGANGAAA